MLGSIERVSGLSIAARIDNFKARRWTKNPRTLIVGECQTNSSILVKSIPLYSESGIFSFCSPQDSSEGIRQRAKAWIEEQKIKI